MICLENSILLSLQLRSTLVDYVLYYIRPGDSKRITEKNMQILAFLFYGLNFDQIESMSHISLSAVVKTLRKLEVQIQLPHNND